MLRLESSYSKLFEEKQNQCENGGEKVEIHQLNKKAHRPKKNSYHDDRLREETLLNRKITLQNSLIHYMSITFHDNVLHTPRSILTKQPLSNPAT